MSERWYPVIDYMICKECGACIRKCSHGVYDSKKGNTPVVLNSKECVDHCHGCGSLCPSGAITYVGEDTGWIPPNRNENIEVSENSSNGCSCSK